MSLKVVENPAVTLSLDTPIWFAGEQITQLALREPTAGDVFRAGNPVRIKGFDPFEIDFDEVKMFAMISRLSGLPIEGTLDRMSASDAVACFYGVAPFFIPGARSASQKSAEQPAN